MPRPIVVLGLFGTTLDRGWSASRWDKWRPTVSLCQQDDFVPDRLELLASDRFQGDAQLIVDDIATVAPETEVRLHEVTFEDPWDFAEVYTVLRAFAESYPFNEDDEDYLVHITTGTHVAQICLFLLAETRWFPAKLIQTAPPRRGGSPEFATIDLDLSRYNVIAERFAAERREGTSLLKAGIDTRNAAFNALIDHIEVVASNSVAPILLTGPTGVGKTHLARRLYELKRRARQVSGAFVEVNCATLRGDGAMSALFGHERGAFTGAASKRAGLLASADGGLLFLDEIGELGLDEQAMLLRAIEDGVYHPLGADTPVTSSFQLIAGTNRDLATDVREGRFREDLLTRIDLWTYALPALRERLEDIEPNLDFELHRVGEEAGRAVSFNREARERFLTFATGTDAAWTANFRDFAAAITRMATLAQGRRIGLAQVDEEIARLHRQWSGSASSTQREGRARALMGHAVDALDRFDLVQLEDVLDVCHTAPTLSAAGRVLFARSRERRTSRNDADRLKKYLARFDLSWADVGRH